MSFSSSILRLFHRRDKVRQDKHAPDDAEPDALRWKSRRPLTPSLDQTPSSRTSFNLQYPSPIFSRLPAELRLLLWQAWAEGPMMHMFWDRGHLGSLRCGESLRDDRAPHLHEVCSLRQRNAQGNLISNPYGVRGPLALLLTCGRVYSEAVRVLYPTTVFDFSFTHFGLLQLQNLVVPSRLQDLTRLNFTWATLGIPIESDIESQHLSADWVRIWESLASLKRLKYLRVEITIYQKDAQHWTAVEDQLLEPIRNVTQPQLFELVLPFPANPKSLALPHATIRRYSSSHTLTAD